MPWDAVSLNDGTMMPSIAFGTWKIGNGQGPIDQVEQALSVGFEHVDTAQGYRNEAEAGMALKESGLARDEVFVTTKFSGMGTINSSIHGSLKNLGLSYVDLYLIHHPYLALPYIPWAWERMEKVKAEGLTKTIGVSNFEVKHLTVLLAHAKVKPVVNQILLHPYVYEKQFPILEYCKANDIVVEAYSCLTPLTQNPGGAVDKPVNEIAARLRAKPEQVLIAWAKAKGAVVVTTSSKKERLEGYLAAGDLQLTEQDILDIDVAGAAGAPGLAAKTMLRRVVGVALIAA
ncbi:Aldo/keto reductase, partial [Rickenella mellea]